MKRLVPQEALKVQSRMDRLELLSLPYSYISLAPCVIRALMQMEWSPGPVNFQKAVNSRAQDTD